MNVSIKARVLTFLSAAAVLGASLGLQAPLKTSFEWYMQKKIAASLKAGDWNSLLSASAAYGIHRSGPMTPGIERLVRAGGKVTALPALNGE